MYTCDVSVLQFVNIIVLSMFAIVIFRPELVQQQANGEMVIDLDGGAGGNSSMVHVHLAKMTSGKNFRIHDALVRHFNGPVVKLTANLFFSERKFVGFLVTGGSLFVTLLLIYGAVRVRFVFV